MAHRAAGAGPTGQPRHQVPRPPAALRCAGLGGPFIRGPACHGGHPPDLYLACRRAALCLLYATRQLPPPASISPARKRDA